jgi:hypothetical protein
MKRADISNIEIYNKNNQKEEKIERELQHPKRFSLSRPFGPIVVAIHPLTTPIVDIVRGTNRLGIHRSIRRVMSRDGDLSIGSMQHVRLIWLRVRGDKWSRVVMWMRVWIALILAIVRLWRWGLSDDEWVVKSTFASFGTRRGRKLVVKARRRRRVHDRPHVWSHRW